MATAKKTKRELVSMTFRKPWGRYTKGDRAGFEPDRAKQLEERKLAVRSAQAKDVEQSAETKQASTKGTEGADKT
ncbi:hypothetical protein [Halomonas lysinitropha]|uniref:Uncharacterized protein n=1 Tax=Halomonas lysinitropha TaxID=2607506 RepID=A0A5K1I4F8_9GAMM|nr:hypothetical protein [Halomonas lysinitropha]VVZ96504.1 hypothetical protein HALO32_02605 [Halomonas lysinitropha]